jgi:hypothetical protein
MRIKLCFKDTRRHFRFARLKRRKKEEGKKRRKKKRRRETN